MKVLSRGYSTQSRSNLLFAGYLAAGFFLLLALQEFIFHRWGIILSEAVCQYAGEKLSYLYGLAGWTLFGFVPMALLLGWFTLRRMVGLAGLKDSAYCRWINELAVGLGLLGTIRGFIVVASQQGGAVGSGPNETLAAILVGMGSTFIGIALALWALLLQSPEES